ncbi:MULTISPECIES: hypothetical protein [Sphingomonadaceae]|jgi:hypothetical protein|uniref:Uncharacterized protein n=1 Tax=Novosphingobium resinovorum TaxID=158500 RepID=A0A031JU01_9SPHN|nr:MULTISPECIES: hypothetical protein [Sphingomonadaceae]AOR76876.1 hypothetical protein BES08_09045 [Novosphingobium resinovorum]EJU10240.1 hypothetical protein LH128_24918 [Sphingomonas sp. LH128]EZP80430.1 hypothetical protein BV97_03517 [Novosphingobium resinovorum]MBF7012243.1 hypothetical protein [Novosphingobium sp. HR1a]WJM26985.1 hypothetical protein QUC32_21590 [Novosphingobium resinovorum]
MTIRFAAAMNGTMPAIAGVLCTGAPLGAVNDNGPLLPRPSLRSIESKPAAEIDAGIAEALMHFARHGLSAAEQARVEAEAAHERGDTAARARWLSICRHLDRRMAAALAKRLAS